MRDKPISSPLRAALTKTRRELKQTDTTPKNTTSKTTTPQNRVVPIDHSTQPDSQKPRLVAHDATTRRVIFGIGSQRLALDITTRITRLQPGTGDAPAPVLPFRKGSKSEYERGPQ